MLPRKGIDSDMSQWREIKGYEGLYLISDEGTVIALPRCVYNGRGFYERPKRELKQGTRAGKYKFVVLTKDGNETSFSVHRLVAEAFLDNPDDLPQVNHKDEDPSNNHVENLEWCTQQYNLEYSKSKPVAQYDADGTKIAEYKSIAYASQMTGILRTAINNAASGCAHTAGGYRWEYI